MKREPVSAEEFARLLRRGIYPCTSGLDPVSGHRLRRAHRLLAHWWRRGIEERAVRDHERNKWVGAFNRMKVPR